jgi:hypothetical protein
LLEVSELLEAVHEMAQGLYTKGTSLDDLHARWLEDTEYRKEYDSLEEEFNIASALMDEATMREIDALCLSPEETASNTEEGMTAASVASGGLGGSPS